ncbi:hypothetical protein [Sphingobacterium hungaricum]|nr:hypothetical protein [Sphingobacterium hungaricum]
MAIHLVESEEGIAAGSAKVKTGWSTNGEQNQPKEKEWEAGWNNSKDFDL